MTDDIVKELRQYKQHKCWTCSEWGCYDDDGKHHWKEERCVCDCHVSPVAAAADEIERLRAESASMREAFHRAMWDDTLIPLAQAFGISILDEYGEPRRQFHMVDALIEEARRD